MKTLLLAALVTCPLPALAGNNSGWPAVMEHAVEKQPAKVGGRAFASAFGVKAWSKEGKEFARAAKRVKEWPVITVEGEALVFTEKATGEGVRLELVNAEEKDFRVNGRPFKVDTDRPLLNQLREALAVPETTEAPFFELIPSARAAVAGAEALATTMYPVVSGASNRDVYRKLASDSGLRRRAELRARPAKFREERRLAEPGADEGLASPAQ